MSEFCRTRFDGLGVVCDRCKCWRRGTEPPDCPPFITRSEPDGGRLPHITSKRQNTRLHREYLAKLDAEINASNEAAA